MDIDPGRRSGPLCPAGETWPHLELLLGFSLLGFTYCQQLGELSRGCRGLWEVAWWAVSRGRGPGLRLGPSEPSWTLSPSSQRCYMNDHPCVCIHVLIRATVSDRDGPRTASSLTVQHMGFEGAECRMWFRKQCMAGRGDWGAGGGMGPCQQAEALVQMRNDRAWPLARKVGPEMSSEDGREEGTWAGVEPGTAAGGTSHRKAVWGHVKETLFPECYHFLRTTPSPRMAVCSKVPLTETQANN